VSATITLPSGQPAPQQPGEFTPAGKSSVVTWQVKRLAPPSPLYVTVDDVLLASAASSATNELVTISYRLLRASDATVVYGQFTLAPPSTRAVQQQVQQLAEGFLLSVSCQAKVATTRGQTFVRLMLNPKALGIGQPAQMLMADYVTTALAPGYPNGRVLAPTEGPGYFVSYQLSSPAPGVEFQFNVPANVRWRIQSLHAILFTDAVAGNRFAELLVFQNGNGIARIPGSVAIPASATAHLTWGPGGSLQSDSSPYLYMPLPTGLILNTTSGSFFQSHTIGLDAGDEWLLPLLGVEEWLDNV
jgi:hypothetical protein